MKISNNHKQKEEELTIAELMKRMQSGQQIEQTEDPEAKPTSYVSALDFLRASMSFKQHNSVPDMTGIDFL